MNDWFETLAYHLLRTTLVTSIAVLTVMWLLWALRIRRPRLHRVAWLLVLVQGWLLMPVTWHAVVDLPRPIAPEPVFVAPAEIDVPPPTPLESSSHFGAAVAVVTLEETDSPAPVTAEPFHLLAFLAAGGFWLWLMGIGALIAIGGWRYGRIFAAGRPGELATDAEWLEEWRQVREASTLRTPVELRTTRGLGPLVCWAPWVFLVLVPRTLWASLTRADRLAILRHELAHCERGDLWKNLVVRVLAVPQWFNPLVWLAVRRFEEAGEWACDDRVAATAGSMDYAKTLLQIADQIAPLPSGAVGMASGMLTRRVERLLHYPNKEVREMRGFILPVLLVAVGLFQVVRIERVAAEQTVEAKPYTAPAELEIAEVKQTPIRGNDLETCTIAPSDTLLITSCKLQARPGYRIQCYDSLRVQLGHGALAFDEVLQVRSDGILDFGTRMRGVQCKVQGLTLQEADRVINKTLVEIFGDPFGYGEHKASILIAQFGDLDFVMGPHLVYPDGKIWMGEFGRTTVAGKNPADATQAMRSAIQASGQVNCTELTLDVLSYHSDRYYVISRRKGRSDSAVAVPTTGYDTIRDALGGLDAHDIVAKVWVERHVPPTTREILDACWPEVVDGASTKINTNFPLRTGDHVIIEYAVPYADDSQSETSVVPTGAREPSQSDGTRATEAPLQVPSRAREKSNTKPKDALPPYVIEPPDIISVRATKLVPRDWPQQLQPFDGLVVQATNVDPEHPINGEFGIDERGKIDLGLPYGKVHAAGWNIQWVERFILQALQSDYPNAAITLKPAFSAKAPQIVGEHLVGPDGRVNLGSYGSVEVNGLTLPEAKQAIEKQLARLLVDPEVTVDIHSYNSKKYYIISRTGSGDPNIVTCPSTGDDTVKDALAAVDGLDGGAKVWVERGSGKEHSVKPVNYEAIARGEDASTNYQLWPNDRLLVEFRSRAEGYTLKKFPVEDQATPNTSLVGEMLLRQKKRIAQAPQPQPTNSKAGTGESLGERQSTVRYQIGLVIDPKRSLREMELEKQGPIVVGESSILLGMLRVLQKNELAGLFEGQLTAVYADGESSTNFCRLRAPYVLGKASDDPSNADQETSLRVVQRVVHQGDDFAFEVRAKLSQGSQFRQIDTALTLNEGQSCLLPLSPESGDPDAGDAYLLITRHRVE